MKEELINNKPIKGITKIELFNKNGELDYVHEEENMFSPCWANFYNSEVIGRLTKGNTNRSVNSFIKYMTFYNSDKTEEDILLNPTLEIEYMGIADLHTAYSGSDKRYGATDFANTDYCALDMEKRKRYIEYVCDFSSSVGTGTFNTISLNNVVTNNNTSFSYYTINKIINSTKYGNYRSCLKRKGDKFIQIRNSIKGESFIIYDKDLNEIRQVAPPVSSQYCAILDLELDNDDIIYVQEFGTKKVYKWTLSTDNFEEVAQWSSYIRTSLRYKENEQDKVCLLECTNSTMSYTSSPRLLSYNSEDFSIGESIGTIYNGGYQAYSVYNAFDFPLSNGDYAYYIQRYGATTMMIGIDELTSENYKKNEIQNDFTSYLPFYIVDSKNGNISIFCFGSSDIGVYTLRTDVVTVNRLSEPITKTAEQSMKVTYRLEMDI